MEIDGIDKVVIDHVKPIDQSLRELTAKGKLPTLSFFSDCYKKAKYSSLSSDKKPSETDIVNDAKELIDKANNNSLSVYNELNNLKLDSWYRLMDSEKNGSKSNNVEFIEYRTDGNGGYIGVILKAQDSEGMTYLVYRDLFTDSNNFFIQDIKKTSYQTIVNLTDFNSAEGKKIL